MYYICSVINHRLLDVVGRITVFAAFFLSFIEVKFLKSTTMFQFIIDTVT